MGSSWSGSLSTPTATKLTVAIGDIQGGADLVACQFEVTGCGVD
jgi:hypothetical protein